MQAGPLMQTPMFLFIWLSPVYVPLSLLQGWIHACARVNPITYALEAGRGLLSGDPAPARESERERLPVPAGDDE